MQGAPSLDPLRSRWFVTFAWAILGASSMGAAAVTDGWLRWFAICFGAALVLIATVIRPRPGSATSRVAARIVPFGVLAVAALLFTALPEPPSAILGAMIALILVWTGMTLTGPDLVAAAALTLLVLGVGYGTADLPPIEAAIRASVAWLTLVGAGALAQWNRRAILGNAQAVVLREQRAAESRAQTLEQLRSAEQQRAEEQIEAATGRMGEINDRMAELTAQNAHLTELADV